ncbi:hypothetical protein TNCV_79491 [Trichonephila clavipes]|nr:hypothetical protein TNCV_79491 [Trichonephila clavipes]
MMTFALGAMKITIEYWVTNIETVRSTELAPCGPVNSSGFPALTDGLFLKAITITIRINRKARESLVVPFDLSGDSCAEKGIRRFGIVDNAFVSKEIYSAPETVPPAGTQTDEVLLIAVNAQNLTLNSTDRFLSFTNICIAAFLKL